MAVFKVVTEKYEKSSDVYNVVNYVLNNQKTPSGYKNSIGLPLSLGAEYICRFFDNLKRYSGITPVKGVYQFVVSFSKTFERDINYYDAYNVGCGLLTEIWKLGFPSLFAVHENTDYVHLHILVSPINFRYKLFPDKQSVYEWLAESIQEYVHKQIKISVVYGNAE